MWNPQRLHCSTTASRNTGNEKKFKIKTRFCKLLIPDYATPRLLSEVRIPLIIPRQGRAERSLQSRPSQTCFLSQNRRIIQNQTPLCDSPKPDTCHSCVVLNQTQRRQATLPVFSQGQAGQVSRFSVTVIILCPVLAHCPVSYNYTTYWIMRVK